MMNALLKSPFIVMLMLSLAVLPLSAQQEMIPYEAFNGEGCPWEGSAPLNYSPAGVAYFSSTNLNYLYATIIIGTVATVIVFALLNSSSSGHGHSKHSHRSHSRGD